MDPRLKQRLLGAAVLILLAVIFVPMLLPDQRETGSQTVSVKIPPEPTSELQTQILQIGPNGASAAPGTSAALLAGNEAAAPVPSPTAATTAAAAVAIASELAAPAPIAPAPAPATRAVVATPPTPTPAAPIRGGSGAAAHVMYSVNLGIYSNRAGANQLVAEARKHGFNAWLSPEAFQGKTVTRVRVGPFRQRAEAEAARLELKGFEHVSMTIDTDTADQAGDAPATAMAAGQAGAWAVQLAAYSDKAAAEALRVRLLGQGFHAYLDGVTSSHGKLWRVRVGPFNSRDAAATARDQLAKKLKLQGNLVVQD